MAEGDAVHHGVRFVVDQFEANVLLSESYHLRGAVVIDAGRAEEWALVARPEGGKFAQLLVEFEIDLVEVEHSGDVERGLCLFVENVFGHVGFETAREFRHVLHSQRESGGIGVSAEVFE